MSDPGGMIVVGGGEESVGAVALVALEVVDRIDWPDGLCRHDTGWRAVAAG